MLLFNGGKDLVLVQLAAKARRKIQRSSFRHGYDQKRCMGDLEQQLKQNKNENEIE